MNIQKIFDALEEDNQNSALGIISSVLEKQGYKIVLNGENVSSEGFFEGKHVNLEEDLNPIHFAVFKNDKVEQEFSIEFTDFHRIAIKK